MYFNAKEKQILMFPITSDTVIWAAPADDCLLEALRGETNPETAGAKAAVVNCGNDDKYSRKLGDHKLKRVTQQELAKLWSVGACRGIDGLPLFAPDGKVMCAFSDELVRQAKNYLKQKELKQKQQRLKPPPTTHRRHSPLSPPHSSSQFYSFHSSSPPLPPPLSSKTSFSHIEEEAPEPANLPHPEKHTETQLFERLGARNVPHIPLPPPTSSI